MPSLLQRLLFYNHHLPPRRPPLGLPGLDRRLRKHLPRGWSNRLPLRSRLLDRPHRRPRNHEHHWYLSSLRFDTSATQLRRGNNRLDLWHLRLPRLLLRYPNRPNLRRLRPPPPRLRRLLPHHGINPPLGNLHPILALHPRVRRARRRRHISHLHPCHLLSRPLLPSPPRLSNRPRSHGWFHRW